MRSFTLNQEAIIRKHYPAQFMGYQSNEKTVLQHKPARIQEMLEHEIGVDHEH